MSTESPTPITAEEKAEMTATPDLVVPATPTPKRRLGTATAVVVAALALGALGGVAWQQHHQPVLVETVAAPPPETVVLTGPPSTIGGIGGGEHYTDPSRDEKRNAVAQEWAQQQRLRYAAFEVRCADAGGNTLRTGVPMCDVDMPAIPAVPAMTPEK